MNDRLPAYRLRRSRPYQSADPEQIHQDVQRLEIMLTIMKLVVSGDVISGPR